MSAKTCVICCWWSWIASRPARIKPNSCLNDRKLCGYRRTQACWHHYYICNVNVWFFLIYELYVTCCNFFLAGHTLQTVSTQHQQGVLLLWVPREEDRPYQAQKSQIWQNCLLWASVHSPKIFKRYVGRDCQNYFKFKWKAQPCW